MVGVNITEANDTNRLLRYVLGVRDSGQLPDDDQMLAAAARLAERVNKAIGCGITPAQVTAAWPNVEVCPTPMETS